MAPRFVPSASRYHSFPMFEDPPSFKRRSPSELASWNQYLATGVMIGITNSDKEGGPSIKRPAILMKEPPLITVEKT